MIQIAIESTSNSQKVSETINIEIRLSKHIYSITELLTQKMIMSNSKTFANTPGKWNFDTRSSQMPV